MQFRGIIAINRLKATGQTCEQAIAKFACLYDCSMATINFFVLNALNRALGIRAFIEHADKSIPEMEWQAQESLKGLAKEEGWEYSQYDGERQGLEADYRHSIPRYTAYSAVILLWSLVETQLFACADLVGEQRGSVFRVRELKGPPLEAAARFLRQVSGLDIKADPAWQQLRDLQDLRDIIVHRDGRKGSVLDQQQTFERLVAKYKPDLSAADTFPVGSELWVSMRLCSTFGEVVLDFLKRLFRGLGFRHSGLDTKAQ